MAFDLFGSAEKCDIRVGYISTDRGLVEGISLYEANKHAKLNPGTQFIFRNRDKVEYININEVNKLTPAQMLPKRRSSLPADHPNACSGIVGLNLEGDTTKSVDEAFDLEMPYTGGSTKEGAISEPDKTEVNFYGGGGVGVQAAPIIGIDGSVLAVQVIHGGYGYKYPPIVDITDDLGNGSGVVAKAIIKTRTSAEDVLVEEYDSEEDYEEYDLETCAPEIVRENIGYGQRFSPDGKDLGKWDPNVYLSATKNRTDPIRYEIERYQKFLADLKKGTIIENNRIKGWWTTRQKTPLRITSSDKVTREKFDVQHHAWGGIASKSSNDNSNKTSSTFGISTELIESSFFVYTSGGQRRGLKFIFKEKSGKHSFQIKADDYKDNASAEEIKIKVKKNTEYKVTTTSKKGIRDQGLLKKGVFGTGGDIAQRTGTSNAIFSDIRKTAPDDDDLQVQCKLGTFSIDKGNITYELKDSAAFNLEKNAKYANLSKDKNKKKIKDSFMNQYAISPVPPSNVKGSDNAGKTYVFEWEEEIPWDGNYVFNVQADNEAHLFIDGEEEGEKILLGKGGAAGHVLSPPTKVTKFLSAGMRKIRLDLLNHQIREMKKIQKDVVATSDEVKFDISISSLFANGITIEGLGIDVSKEYGEGKNIKESIIKKVEYGRVYLVKMRSSGFKQQSSSSTAISISGLKNPGDVRYKSPTRIEFDDNSGNGFDVNGSFTIDRVGPPSKLPVRNRRSNPSVGSVVFSKDARGLDVKGEDVEVTLTYSWNDNPRTSGKAISSIKIGSTTWTQTNSKRGSETRTIIVSSSSFSSSGHSSNIKLKTKGEKVVAMEDLPGQAAGSAGVGFFDDIICSVNNGRFYGISGSSCNFVVDAPVTNKAPSTRSQKGERAHVFNTLDFIKKANRKLWKINPSSGKDGDFLNRFGILPFDPTAVAKIEKKRTKTVEIGPTGAPPRVKFEIGDDGKNYLRVVGNGRVKVGFEMKVNDSTRISGLALREVKIQADDGEILMDREKTTTRTIGRGRRQRTITTSRISKKSKHTGIGIFSSGKKYEIKALGGSKTSGSIIGVDKTSIGYDDDITNGYDQNANIKITSVTPLTTTKQVEESYFGYPEYPNASTDDYAGFHEIIWNNITFPESGNYSITTMVDDNVVLTFSSKNNKDIVLDKKGFTIRGDWRTGSGKSTEIKYFKAGTYTLKAVLEQVPGAALANGNPMALAVDVKAAFISDEIEVISAKSWNENPMGVAMSIDAPLAPPPKEPPQLQEGRCPNNPIWTTRSPADKTWYPVRVNKWAKFMNRYSLSPLPPLGFKGTDGAGTVYRNSWTVELPYKGFYGVKGTVDNFGKLFIDGVEVLGPNADKNFDNYNNPAPQSKKIFLEEKTIDITVEVENEKQFIWNTIDQKVFSTADWASKQNTTSTTIEGPKNIDVDFKVSIATMYAAGIKLFDGNTPLFDDNKGYKKPAVFENHTHNIELGKVYDVEFTSSNTNTIVSPNGIVYNGLKEPGDLRYSGPRRLKFDDNSANGFDTNASFTIDNVVNGNVNFATDGRSFVVKGSNVKVTLTYSWNDNPKTSGKALNSIKIGSTTWTQTNSKRGSETHTITLSDGKSGVIRNDGSNNSNIKLRNKGKNVVEMEDIPQDFSAGTGGTNDESFFFKDIVCSASDGEFFNLQGRKCKFRIPSKDRTEIKYGKGLTSGSSKNGVTYDGPPLSTYVTGTLGPFITPTWNTDEDYIANFNGKTWTMTWSGVDFPEKGTYDIQVEADDKLIVKVDGSPIASAEVGNGITKTQFNASKGKRKIELVLTNIDFNAPFSENPTVAAVKITRKVDVAKVDPRTGTALGKPWTVNPLGVSAILIPPPCPKKINGVGIVTAVIITDPGSGFPPITPPDRDDPPEGPPVIIEVDEIVPEDEGINYDPDDQVCIVNTETGEEICYVPPKTPTTGIGPFKPSETPLAPGTPGGYPDGDGDSGRTPPNGYRKYPDIIVKTKTGIGYKGIPLLSSVIDPIGVTDPDRLIQVTDLPGLKRTGYYDGKPYYGAVFYEDGIRYAGYYDTPGQKVQIYDTMQESIDAEVTTPPSAIQRQGTDINSNDPRLNIPGTPDNLT